MVKAVRGLGLDVSSVDFDGDRVSVKIASSGENLEPKRDGLIREPQT